MVLPSLGSGVSVGRVTAQPSSRWRGGAAWCCIRWMSWRAILAPAYAGQPVTPARQQNRLQQASKRQRCGKSTEQVRRPLLDCLSNRGGGWTMCNPINRVITDLSDVYSKLHMVTGSVDLIYIHCLLDETVSEADAACLHGCSLVLKELAEKIDKVREVPPCT